MTKPQEKQKEKIETEQSEAPKGKAPKPQAKAVKQKPYTLDSFILEYMQSETSSIRDAFRRFYVTHNSKYKPGKLGFLNALHDFRGQR